ncbi:MAG TPA: mersacidin/lichenicidin family type 2 lantibiotic [Blastocatellia bacterium]|nr:mersacidin/lichenicidin family type 2 lantibiotic [Blastocatellia bacterium]
MQDIDKIIRAWKDEDYRLSLTDEERAGLPEHPAGMVELSDAELNQAAGGTIFSPLCVPTFAQTFCQTLRFCSLITTCS